MSPPSPQLLDLADLWSNFNPVLEFLSPKDLALFSNTNKKSLKYVQTLFKFINKSYENSDYGFTRENWYQEGGMRLKFKLPHKNCLLKVWEDKGNISDHVPYRKSNHLFENGAYYPFAKNAIAQIVKIEQRFGGAIKVHGWILSGSCTHMMRNSEGLKYFRPYPFWTYITIDTYKRFKLLPGLLKK